MAEPRLGDQLAIELPHEAALGRGDLIVHAGNAAAVALIERWPDWQGGILALSGPPAAGKTHLASVWADQADALILPAGGLILAEVPEIARRPLLIEDADNIADETAFFHLINQVRENGSSLLVTARAAPARWPAQLADLTSRLAALPVATLGLPDETVLSQLMQKLLGDRQLPVDPRLADWAVTRIDRTPAAVRKLAASLDRYSLALGRRLGPKLVREVVAAMRDD